MSVKISFVETKNLPASEQGLSFFVKLARLWPGNDSVCRAGRDGVNDVKS